MGSGRSVLEPRRGQLKCLLANIEGCAFFANWRKISY
ncbi:hypothetical protein CsSME_00037062 [Camellia sinensis var. sinensis]